MANSGRKAPTKSEVLSAISEKTELSRKQVNAVFDQLGKLIGKSLTKAGSGVFTVPGLMKVTAVRKPATKEREGINPFTGEKAIFKAKPARTVVKIRPLKGLKDMVK